MAFEISTDPELPPTRGIAVGHRRKSDHMVMSIIAVFSDKDEAQTWANNANEWYGSDHPMYPLTIVADNLLIAPRPFPVEALRAMERTAATERAEAEQHHAVADVEAELEAAASLPELPF